MPNTLLRTSSGDIYFDAVLNTDHNNTVTPTTHPVQTGASISDHAIFEPTELTMEIGMTDVKGGDGASARMYQTLRNLMQKREAITVVTRLGTYSNMLITSLSTPDDVKTMKALRATIIFTEIKVVSVATIKIQQTTSGSKSTVSGVNTAAQNSATTTAQQIVQTATTGTGNNGNNNTAATTTSTATKKQSASSSIVSYTTKSNESIFQKVGAAIKTAATNVVNTAKTVVSKIATAIQTTVAKTATTTTTQKATTTPTKLAVSKASSKVIALKK